MESKQRIESLDDKKAELQALYNLFAIKMKQKSPEREKEVEHQLLYHCAELELRFAKLKYMLGLANVPNTTDNQDLIIVDLNGARLSALQALLEINKKYRDYLEALPQTSDLEKRIEILKQRAIVSWERALNPQDTMIELKYVNGDTEAAASNRSAQTFIPTAQAASSAARTVVPDAITASVLGGVANSAENAPKGPSL